MIIAVRNGAATLERALDSVFEQTHPDVELIVMDGASSDGTVAILEQNSAQITYWESKPDRGIYHAWNKALDHATGDWICFLGADDRVAAPTALLDIAGALAEAWPPFRVVYGEVDLVRPDGSLVSRRGSPWADVRGEFLSGMAIPHPATFQHRELFELRGRFDERFVIAGDYEFLLRELCDREALFAPGVVVEIGAGGVSDRLDTLVLRMREAERARRMHGLTRFPEWCAPAVLRARCRVLIMRTAGPGAEARATSAYRSVRGRIRRWTAGAR